MTEQRFLCNKCNKMTNLVPKTDKLANDIRHEYAECQNCAYKATIMYTDKHIRKLMKRQKTEVSPVKRMEREAILETETQALRKRIGS